MDIVGNIYDLAPGTQIKVKRSWRNLDPSLGSLHYLFTLDDYYYHHGVYLGCDEVVHFYGPDKDNAIICFCSLSQFMSLAMDNELRKVQHNVNNVEPESILIMAERYKLDRRSFGRYNLLRNNCESFATFLTTGKKISDQADKALKSLCKNISILLLVVLVILFINRSRIRPSSR